MGKPFLKWVGGKRQLLGELSKHLPSSTRYFEPFLGGGAAFFFFAGRGRFQQAVLNDVNDDLMTTYRVVKTQPEDLAAALKACREEADWNTSEGYARLRSSKPAAPLQRAVRFICLNKLGFNGLYRVNQSGEMNTPFGRYDDPRLYDHDALMECSRLLGCAELWTGDYSAPLTKAQRGDVVYLDPPYHPVSETSNFASYAADSFSDEDQIGLAEVFRDLVERGVYCVLSNSDTPLIREFYQDFKVHVVSARRSVNSDPTRRGPINELVVVGRPESWQEQGPRDILQELAVID